jgi:hypothetical protein
VRPFVRIVATVLIATVLGHAFLTATVAGKGWIEGFSSAPGAVTDRLVHGDFGATPGYGCNFRGAGYTPLCASYTPSTVAAMLRTRVPLDLTLLLVGPVHPGRAHGDRVRVRDPRHVPRAHHRRAQAGCPGA